MNHLHKEKERLRHQKQVKLLNEVMKYVPKVPNEPQSKVRNLRNLVLYFHYLQIKHSNVTQRLCSNDTAVENCVKSSITKRTSKPIKVFHPPKKRQKAHIVFLHADKTGKVASPKSRKEHYNILEVQNNGQELSSVLPSCYEYKVPDGSRTDLLINQEDKEIDHLQEIKDFSIPLNNRDKSVLCNNENAFEDLDSNFFSKNYYCKEKENFLPIASNCEAFDYNVKESVEYSLYDIDKFAHNIVINDENLRASKHKLDNFHSSVTNDIGNNDLENFEFSNAKNKNFKIPNPSSCDKGKEYLLKSYDSNNIQNFNPGYESSSFTTKNFHNSSSDYSDWHNFDFSLNSDSRQPIYYDESSATEKTSNYSTSSSSMTKINIDVENLSDSSRSCNNLSDNSNFAQYNSCNSCINVSHNPLSNFTKLETLEMESDAFPLLLPNFGYIENSSILMNDSLIGQMYDTTIPQFSGVYPSRINFNMNSNSSVFQPDSVHLFKNEIKEPEDYKDFEYLYSPSLYNNSNSEQLSMLLPKQTVTSFNNLPGSFITENNQPVLFEEEVSYPLTDYLNNY